MKRTLRTALLLLLCLTLYCCLVPAAHAEEVASGECGANGDNLTWTLDDTGELVISGTGDMKYYDAGKAPWYTNRLKITSAVIGDGVTSIGSDAFYYCIKLETIEIAQTVHFVGSNAFDNCTKLTSVVLPEGVTSISGHVFSGCSSLTSMTIPEGVTSISNYAFSGCSSLTSMTIPEGVPSIRSGAFSDCSSLTSVTIPESVASIGSDAFRGCSSLTSMTIPEGVTSIGSGAFSGCSSVTIPESMKYIDRYAFYDCSNLKDVYYSGTKEQWEAVDIDDYNDPLRNATIHYGTVPDTFTVSYNANGGTDAPAAQTKEPGVALTLSAVAPTRTNNSAGSYTVTLNANGGSVSPTSLNAARTTSYTFKNWNTAADGSGTDYAPGAAYSTDANVTLYAQWESKTTTAAVALPTPTRSGYSFKGWGTSSTSTSGVTGSYTPTRDLTLYAIWQSADFILPASLTTIEDEAFEGGAFRYVQLAEGTASISSRAFADCPNLRYIYIPEATGTIAKDAFEGVTGLTILGRSGSYAEFYAQRNGIAFVAVD